MAHWVIDKEVAISNQTSYDVLE